MKIKYYGVNHGYYRVVGYLENIDNVVYYLCEWQVIIYYVIRISC